MKVIITESQLKLLIEQKKWYENPGFEQFAPTEYEKREREKATNLLDNLNPHTIATIAAIGTTFIPVIGPFISAGIQIGEAALYYKEGDKKNAGMSLMFTLIPLAGPLLNKIPGAKQLGQKGMQMLAAKLMKNSKLTKLEKEVAESVVENKDLVLSETNKVVKQLANTSASKVQNPSVKKQILNFALRGVGQLAGYSLAGSGYNMAYNYLNPELDFSKFTDVDPSQINKANLEQAQNMKFD